MAQAEKSQLEAIASLIELNGAQAQAAICEVDAVAESLTESFAKLRDLMDKPPLEGSSKTRESEVLSTKRDKAMLLSKEVLVQLQGFDRTAQRLSHLRDSLLVITDYMNSDVKQGELSIMTQEFYSLAHEVELLDLVNQGASRESLLSHALSPQDKTIKPDLSDELF
ncbi:MAG: hypothetical protein AB8B95_10365 [Pseudohongiellaceae bacterium]